MKKFLFKDRDGRTPLPEDFKKGLIPKHIETGGELDEYEERNIIEGLVWLEGCKDSAIDYLFWNRLHKNLFGNVWVWAGKFRSHELANPDFNHPRLIIQNIKILEGDLKYQLKNNSYADSREIIARFHERFLTIHPYTNGRTSRILTEYICQRENILIPTWGQNLKEDPAKHRQAYLGALLKARYESSYSDLLNFLYS